MRKAPGATPGAFAARHFSKRPVAVGDGHTAVAAKVARRDLDAGRGLSPFVLGTGNRNYDISPDDHRFLMVSEEHEASVGEIRVVLNWFEELKRLAPPSE